MIYPINHLPDKIPIGIQTEQGVEVIGFDLKPWLDALPDMHFTVCHTRPGETDAYPVNDHMMVGMVLYWHPDGYDTAIAGEGKVEIVGVWENRRKLSGFVPTAIPATSLGTTKEPGESVAPWYEAVLQAAQDVKADVDVGTGGLYLVNTKNGKADRTQDEIKEAVAARKTCLYVSYSGQVYTYWGEKDYFLPSAGEKDCPTFIRYEYTHGTGIILTKAQVLSTGVVSINSEGASRTPNPKSLTLTGAESATYDGSEAVSVEIPGVYVVTISSGDSGYVANHTYAEIIEAINAGKACMAYLSAARKLYPISTVKGVDAVLQFGLVEYDDYNSVLYNNYITITKDDVIKYRGGSVVTHPPKLSSSDIMYQRWNGSEWEAATIDQLKADLGLT